MHDYLMILLVKCYPEAREIDHLLIQFCSQLCRWDKVIIYVYGKSKRSLITVSPVVYHNLQMFMHLTIFVPGSGVKACDYQTQKYNQQ